MKIKNPLLERGSLLLVQPCFFSHKFVVMPCCFEIEDDQRQAQNNEYARNKVSDGALEDRQLVNAEKQDETSEEHRCGGSVPFFADRQCGTELFCFIIEIKHDGQYYQKYEY